MLLLLLVVVMMMVQAVYLQGRLHGLRVKNLWWTKMG